jgi:hypothetical protein
MSSSEKKNKSMNWYKHASMVKTASRLRGQWWIIDGKADKVGFSEGVPVHGRYAMELAEQEISPLHMEIINAHSTEMEALGIRMDDVRALNLQGSPLWKLETHIRDIGRTDSDFMNAQEIASVQGMDDKRRDLFARMEDEARASIPRHLWRAVHSGTSVDAEQWLLGKGCVAISDHNIRMASASFDLLRKTAIAMELVLPDISGDSTVNIDVGTGSTIHYADVPWQVIREGDVGALRGHRN